MQKIIHCTNCQLHKNQLPASNQPIKSDIMIIGISSKKNSSTKTFSPLDISTNSGKFILQLEKSLKDKTFYKTNLIKCAPLSDDGKIRYPTNFELNSCLPHLEQEIKTVNPKIIITLGKQVTDFISELFELPLPKYQTTTYKNFAILPIDHPSYIMIYKRKQIKQYKNKITDLIIRSGA